MQPAPQEPGQNTGRSVAQRGGVDENGNFVLGSDVANALNDIAAINDMPTEQPQGNAQQPIRVPEGYQPAVRESGFEMPAFDGLSDNEVGILGKNKMREIVNEGPFQTFDGLNVVFPDNVTDDYINDVFEHVAKGKGGTTLNRNRVRALWLLKNTLQTPQVIFEEQDKGTRSYMAMYQDGRNMTHQMVVKVKGDGNAAVITSIVAKDSETGTHKKRAIQQFLSKLKNSSVLYVEGEPSGIAGSPHQDGSTGNASVPASGNQTITHPTAAGNPIKIVTPDGSTEIDAQQQGPRMTAKQIAEEARAVRQEVYQRLKELGVDESEAWADAELRVANWARTANEAQKAGMSLTVRDQADRFFVERGIAPKIGGNVYEQDRYDPVKYQGKLKQDRIAWAKAVDKFLIGEMGDHDIVRVMDMPLAMELAGAPVREIVADKTFFNHTVAGKHSGQIKPSLMKKLVKSLTDPIMVFDSASHPGTSLVAMLELEDDQGATIVVPVRLQMDPTDPNSPAKITSFYGKGDPQTGIPNNKWFIKQVVDKNGNLTGRLKYVNRKKLSRWSSVGGLQLPRALAPSGLPSSISTEADLVKMRKMNGNRFYQSFKENNKKSTQWAASIGLQSPGAATVMSTYKNILPGKSDLVKERANYGDRFYQSAWHGSPHVFDKFDLGAIGTGEGAQVHGWGLYFAQNKKIAQSYKNLATDQVTRLKVNGITYNFENGAWHDANGNEAEGLTNYYLRELQSAKGDVAALVRYGESNLRQYERSKHPTAIENAQEWRNYIDFFNKNEIEILENPGSLFEVDVPENEVLLDEDKTLNEQPLPVRKAIIEYYKSRPDSYIVPSSPSENLGGFTGRDFYGEVLYQLKREGISDTEAPQAASELLNSLGIKGITYDGLRDGRCFVVFDDKAISVIERYNQEAARNTPQDYAQLQGQISFDKKKQTSTITLFENADHSTFVHEMGHDMLNSLIHLGRNPDAGAVFKQDLQTALEYLGMTDFDFDHVTTEEQQKRLTEAHEKWARSFEAYLMEGKAPTSRLARVFENMKRWLLDIYDNMRNLNVELSPEVRDLFDRLLGRENAAAQQTESAPSPRDYSVQKNAPQDAGRMTSKEFDQWMRQTQREGGVPIQKYHTLFQRFAKKVQALEETPNVQNLRAVEQAQQKLEKIVELIPKNVLETYRMNANANDNVLKAERLRAEYEAILQEQREQRERIKWGPEYTGMKGERGNRFSQ